MRILSTRKYASEFNIGYSTVVKWCKTGKLETITTDGGQYKILIREEKTEEEKQKKIDKYLMEVKINLETIAELTIKNTKILNEINNLKEL